MEKLIGDRRTLHAPATAFHDGRSLRFPGAASGLRLVRDPFRDSEHGCILEWHRLGGISCSGLYAINEGFRQERGALRLGEISTRFDPAMKIRRCAPLRSKEIVRPWSRQGSPNNDDRKRRYADQRGVPRDLYPVP